MFKITLLITEFFLNQYNFYAVFDSLLAADKIGTADSRITAATGCGGVESSFFGAYAFTVFFAICIESKPLCVFRGGDEFYPFYGLAQIGDDFIYTRNYDNIFRSETQSGYTVTVAVYIIKFALFGYGI